MLPSYAHSFHSRFLYSNADRSWPRCRFFFLYFFFFYARNTGNILTSTGEKQSLCTHAEKHGWTPGGVVRNSVAEEKKYGNVYFSPRCYSRAFPRKNTHTLSRSIISGPRLEGRILSREQRDQLLFGRVSFDKKTQSRGSGKESPSRNSKLSKTLSPPVNPSLFLHLFQSTSPFSTQRQTRVTGSEKITRRYPRDTFRPANCFSRNPPPPPFCPPWFCKGICIEPDDECRMMRAKSEREQQ